VPEALPERGMQGGLVGTAGDGGRGGAIEGDAGLRTLLIPEGPAEQRQAGATLGIASPDVLELELNHQGLEVRLRAGDLQRLRHAEGSIRGDLLPAEDRRGRPVGIDVLIDY